MIVAGGLNGKEEVLSSVEIIQHSDGALQVKTIKNCQEGITNHF